MISENPQLNTEDIQSLPLEVESQDSIVQTESEDLYWERDEVSPNQVLYDLENNQVIVPTSDEELITPIPLPIPNEIKRVVSRNVNNTRRRNFR